MTTAAVAIIANSVVELLIGLAAVFAVWNLIRSGKVRLTAPTVPQIQAEQNPSREGAGNG